MHDLLILGGGPSGMTAALYAARKNLNTILISKNLGGQMIWSGKIENYIGVGALSGAELTNKFHQQLLPYSESLSLKIGETVLSLNKIQTGFEVKTSASTYYSKAVILATGRTPKLLNVPGEKELLGHGVSTCAVCDGPFFKDKIVAVVGGGNSALDTCLTLGGSAKKIYSVNIGDKFTGEESLIKNVGRLFNIEFIKNAKVNSITGKEKVTGIEIFTEAGIKELVVDGVFIEIGYAPEDSYEDLCLKNHDGTVKVGSNLETNVPGLYCAGDLNDCWGEQIIIAAGEGAKAALAVARFIRMQS